MKYLWKQMHVWAWLGLWVPVFFVPAWAAPSVNASSPEQLVTTLSQSVIEELNQNRSRYLDSPQAVKEFADAYVLPYVDTYRMARYVMGRHWRMANDSQQNAFAEAFEHMLLRSYARSLLKLEIESVAISQVTETRPGRASVQSEVRQADGNASRVDYRAYFNEQASQWQLYDMTVEGVSLLLNYRKTYASEFSRKGVGRVINELQEKNAQALQSGDAA